MNKNNCYECKYHLEIPGSAHSGCSLFPDLGDRLNFAAGVGAGKVSGLDLTVRGESTRVIQFNEVGIRRGWCFWPLDFDPVWVECSIPMEVADELNRRLAESKN